MTLLPGPIQQGPEMRPKSKYDAFKDVMFLDGPLIRVIDRLNMKQPLTDNIYRETTKGWVPINTFYNNCLEILELNGITKASAQKQYIERLARDITIEDDLNKDSEYLVATPSGEVLDLKALWEIKVSNQDPEKHAEKWRKHNSEYSENRITLRTGVDYNPEISADIGNNIIWSLLQAMTYYLDGPTLNDTVQWVINFMGRLLIGGNIWKEFVTLLGQKDSGKTTFVGILKDIMGSYCGVIKDEILQSSDTDSINRSLYVLKDKKLLIHSEGTNQKKTNTVTLKRITGDSQIPLGNQDYSFTMKGKIIEDTNYFPMPDNPDDEAFNERVAVIPFWKNTNTPKPYIDDMIKRARDNKEAIFVTMVHAATFSIGSNVQKTKPWVSEQAKHCIYILRNLEKVFYERICDANVTDNITATGQAVHRSFQEWVTACIKPALAIMPYLASEKVDYPTETEFHAKMKKLHLSYETHSREGLRYRGIFIHRDRIYWNVQLFWKENSPVIAAKRLEAKEAEMDRKRIESFTTKDTLKNELEKSITKDREMARQDRNRNNSNQNNQIPFASNPQFPMNMGPNPMYDNQWQSGPYQQTNPYMFPFPPPVNTSTGPVFTIKKPKPSTPEKTTSKEDSAPEDPPADNPPPEKPPPPEDSPPENSTHLIKPESIIPDEEYDKIAREIGRSDERYFRVILPEELDKYPEGSYIGMKTMYHPNGVMLLADEDVRDIIPGEKGPGKANNKK